MDTEIDLGWRCGQIYGVYISLLSLYQGIYA